MSDEEPGQENAEVAEKLYASDDIQCTEPINGIIFRIREIDSEQFMNLTEQCVDRKGNMNRKKYMFELVTMCVEGTEPDLGGEINPSKLKPMVLTSLTYEIEKILGLTDEHLKNLVDASGIV